MAGAEAAEAAAADATTRAAAISAAATDAGGAKGRARYLSDSLEILAQRALRHSRALNRMMPGAPQCAANRPSPRSMPRDTSGRAHPRRGAPSRTCGNRRRPPTPKPPRVAGSERTAGRAAPAGKARRGGARMDPALRRKMAPGPARRKARGQALK